MGFVIYIYATQISPLEKGEYEGRGTTKLRGYEFVFPYARHAHDTLEKWGPTRYFAYKR